MLPSVAPKMFFYFLNESVYIEEAVVTMSYRDVANLSLLQILKQTPFCHLPTQKIKVSKHCSIALDMEKHHEHIRKHESKQNDVNS